MRDELNAVLVEVISTVYGRLHCIWLQDKIETLERQNSDIPGHNFDAVSPRSAQAITMQMPALRPAAVSAAAQPEVCGYTGCLSLVNMVEHLDVVG